MGAISNDWLEPLSPEFKKPYYARLYKTVKEEYSTHKVFPPADDIFNAFDFTPLSQVKVVILGQDPYHNEHQAHGLSFSVLPDQREIPPSLQNIYKELHDDLGCYIPDNGKMGKAGRADVKYGIDGAGPPGEFSSRTWLGAVYRCDTGGSESGGPADRVSVVG